MENLWAAACHEDAMEHIGRRMDVSVDFQKQPQVLHPKSQKALIFDAADAKVGLYLILTVTGQMEEYTPCDGDWAILVFAASPIAFLIAFDCLLIGFHSLFKEHKPRPGRVHESLLAQQEPGFASQLSGFMEFYGLHKIRDIFDLIIIIGSSPEGCLDSVIIEKEIGLYADFFP